MIVYSATKQEFVADARSNQVHTKVVDETRRRLNLRAGPSEVAAWRNSLQFMSNVLNDDDIPANSKVSIEYQLPLSSKRIDFILTGKNAKQQDSAVIIELKQWSEVAVTEKDAIVRTFLGRGEKETAHPSYQAWSYAAMLDDFNETVRKEDIQLVPCAYLHNLDNDHVINDARYAAHTAKAPVFISKDAQRLTEFLKKHVHYGDNTDVMYRIEHGRLRPSRNLADSLSKMMQGNEEFVLIDEQKVVFEAALELAHKAQRTGKKQVLIVDGGPGTGKSVLAINLLVALNNKEMLTQYVSKNAAPRAVYAAMLAGTQKKTRVNNLFKGSGAFVATENNLFDALLVDEAHRLNEKSGLYGNLGEHQVKELINAAKCTVFFLDEDQLVTLKDVGNKESIRAYAKQLNANVTELQLSAQFRCSGSDAYIAWLDNALQKRETANTTLYPSDFEFKVFDDPNDLRAAVELKNKERNKARLVAGYCWPWNSKKDKTADDIVVREFGFAAQWNLTQDGSLWAIAEESVSEIGCIHTCQGLELDYVGVIIGPDLLVRDGQVICDVSKRATADQTVRSYKKLLQAEPEQTRIRLDAIIKNTYRTLMTRAQKGCYIYSVDPETNAYFRALLAPTLDEQPIFENKEHNDIEPLPFRIMRPHEVVPYKNAVPVFDLKIAAGRFTPSSDVDEHEWAKLPEHINIGQGMFVAQVIGESMNKRIPNGSWCLFRANPGGTRQGKIVLVQLRDYSDPELGGAFTVKRYSSNKRADENGLQHHSITLSPESHLAGFEAISLAAEQAEEMAVIGEFLVLV